MAKSRKSVKSADKSDKSAETSTEADKTLPEGEETAVKEQEARAALETAVEDLGVVAAGDSTLHRRRLRPRTM